MNQNLGDLDVAEMPLPKDVASAAKASPAMAPAPSELGQHLDQSAILLDIDGTLLDLAPTPREVWVPPGLAKTLNRLLERTSGALALVYEILWMRRVLAGIDDPPAVGRDVQREGIEPQERLFLEEGSGGSTGEVDPGEAHLLRRAVSDREVLARGSDVNLVGPDRCFLDNLRDLHTSVLAQQLDHHAFMGGIEVRFDSVGVYLD